MANRHSALYSLNWMCRYMHCHREIMQLVVEKLFNKFEIGLRAHTQYANFNMSAHARTKQQMNRRERKNWILIEFRHIPIKIFCYTLCLFASFIMLSHRKQHQFGFFLLSLSLSSFYLICFSSNVCAVFVLHFLWILLEKKITITLDWKMFDANSSVCFSCMLQNWRSDAKA